MSVEKKIEDTHTIAKKVFSKAALSKLELIPEVYGVWYAYFSGNYAELTAELDEAIASGKHLDKEFHAKLFLKHLQPEESKRAAELAVAETQLIIKGVLNEILGASSSTANYTKHLNDYASQIEKADNLSDVKDLIGNLLKQTSTAAASGNALQSKLSEATEKSRMLEQKLAAVEAEASIDALTGLYNRKSFNNKLMDLFEEYRDRGTYFSAIMIDIDFFKKFNDTYGHQTGDLVLQAVGDTLHRSVKGADFPARYGGEEFVVLLPETTLENAIVVAEQLRVRISMRKIEDDTHPDTVLKVTASMGVGFATKQDTMQTLIRRADKALYLAKEEGRNQVKSERDLH